MFVMGRFIGLRKGMRRPCKFSLLFLFLFFFFSLFLWEVGEERRELGGVC